MTDQDVIGEFNAEYRWLSNFHPSPIERGGIRYPTVEHAFQAGKTRNSAEQRVIAEASTPGVAKRLGRSVDLRSDWDQIKVGFMADCLMAKFTLHPTLRDQLVATWPAKLVEGNTWHDQFWGNCICGRPACGIPGMNNLGKLLMELRERLRLA